MKLTKGKISKIYLKKKQSMRKYKKRGKSGKKNGIKKTFRKRGHLDLNRRTLKRLPKKKMFGGEKDEENPDADKKVEAEAVDEPQDAVDSQAVVTDPNIQSQDAVDSQEAVTDPASQPQDAVDSKDTVVPEAAVDSQEVVTDQTSQPQAVNESQSVAEELQDKASNDAQPPVDAEPQETSLEADIPEQNTPEPGLQSTDLQSTGLQSPGLQKDEETIGKLIKDMIKAEIADQLAQKSQNTPINLNSSRSVDKVNRVMASSAENLFSSKKEEEATTLGQESVEDQEQRDQEQELSKPLEESNAEQTTTTAPESVEEPKAEQTTTTAPESVEESNAEQTTPSKSVEEEPQVEKVEEEKKELEEEKKELEEEKKEPEEEKSDTTPKI